MEADVCNDNDNSTETKTINCTVEPEKEFILAYEALPQLWDTSDMRYSNRLERFKALGKLLPIYRKLKPYATIENVKKKINSLRSNFRRELKKFIASERSGSGASDVYYPKVWYFPYLNFLRKLEHPNSQFQEEITLRHDESDTLENIKLEESFTNVRSKSSSRTISPSSSRTKSPSPPKKMKSNINRDKFQTDQFYPETYKCQHQCQSISNPIALEWANTLETLDPLQRLYAKKAINDILFEAELGNLHKHSVRINESNAYYLPTSPQVGTSTLQSPPQQHSPLPHGDPVSLNNKDDSISDVDYKIPITFCNPVDREDSDDDDE